MRPSTIPRATSCGSRSRTLLRPSGCDITRSSRYVGECLRVHGWKSRGRVSRLFGLEERLVVDGLAVDQQPLDGRAARRGDGGDNRHFALIARRFDEKPFPLRDEIALEAVGYLDGLTVSVAPASHAIGCVAFDQHFAGG